MVISLGVPFHKVEAATETAQVEAEKTANTPGK